MPRVLVAEDNLINQKVIRVMLGKNGWDCVIVENGVAAVELAREGAFQVALMDCQMPVMDGLEAASAIREEERKSSRPRMPILAITANAMSGDKEKCLAAGMDGFISKPFKMNELIAAITPFLIKGG